MLNGRRSLYRSRDGSGALHVFNAITGEELWKVQLEGQCASRAVGDLQGDPLLEIVISTGAGKVFALDAVGEMLWTFDMGRTSLDWATCSPVLFDDSHENPFVAVASSHERIYCLDCEGNVSWERLTRGGTASSISVGDIDKDGRADLFLVTQLGMLYRFDEGGALRWEIDTQGRSLAPGAIIDMDGDGDLNYVLCTQNGHLFVFEETGEVAFEHQFDNRTINMTPTFGDILPDRPGLEFAVTGALDDKTLDNDVKATIRRFFEEFLAQQASQAFGDAHVGVARYVLDATYNDATVASMREGMMHCVETLISFCCGKGNMAQCPMGGESCLGSCSSH